MVEKLLRVLVTTLVLIVLSSTVAGATPSKEEMENSIKIQYAQPKANDDQVNAARAQQQNTELAQASDEINKDFQKHKALMGVGVAALAVGAIYVGSHNWHDLQDKVGVDRVAHFGVSYIINDQLQAAGMTKLEATLTTIAIGAAKEKWVDNKWDGGDFTADCLGALAANISF